MHGRGSQAGRGDAGGTPQTARPCRVVPRGESRIGPTRADAAKIGADEAQIGADAAQIGPTRSVSAGIGRIGQYRPKRSVRPKFKKKKRKKKVQNAPFDLT